MKPFHKIWLVPLIILINILIEYRVISSKDANEDSKKELYIYGWSDYITKNSLQKFEQETGINVLYDVFDNNVLLDAKISTGNLDYDIVMPSASPYLQRQLRLGRYRPLDKSKLPNYKNLNPTIMGLLNNQDPGNKYGIPWMWGSIAIGYNVDWVKKIMPDAPVDSLSMIFDPNIIAKFAQCGVVVLDSADDMLTLALLYAKKNPKTQDIKDLSIAEEIFMQIRPYVKNFHITNYAQDLANGEICLAVGWSGDIAQAAKFANTTRHKVNIGYHLPREGSQIWVDVMAIPKDAKHYEEALEFINFMLRPEIAAENSNYLGYPNANKASFEMIKPDIRYNKEIYPPKKIMQGMYIIEARKLEFDRASTKIWNKILMGM
jgi:putrescine transport system substrate-binding protein